MYKINVYYDELFLSVKETWHDEDVDGIDRLPWTPG
jgi:hypothetical protein